jgi:hypothetical protein
MSQTRREFLIVSGAAVIGATLSGATPSPVHGSEPTLLEGDPYTAHVDENGLGGRSWNDAYEHALRFRSTPEDRDRYVLGLEI